MLLCVVNKEYGMNKKLWFRLLLTGVLATSLLAVAGCGETPEEKQAKMDKMVQESAAQEVKTNIELAHTVSKADTWTKAINSLKEKGELKSAPVQVSGELKYKNGTFTVDVVKPGTKELLRYTYDLHKHVWSDGAPVQILGAKSQIDQTFYSIDMLNANMMVTIIEKFKQEGQTNPELKDTYKGYFNVASMGWEPRIQNMMYTVEQTADGRTDLLNSQSIETVYDSDGNIIKLRVKVKGVEATKQIL